MYVLYMTPSQWCLSGLFLSLSSSATSQAETSQFTDCTVVPTPDELSHLTASQFPQLAPPKIVVDDVVVQQKCKVDVQPSSHVSENQSRSGECFMLSMYTIVCIKSLFSLCISIVVDLQFCSV